jgi:hypothetical protein
MLLDVRGYATRKTRDDGGVAMATKDKTLKYSQEIGSPAEHEERPGRSLWTQDHETIQRWAEERGAKPATVAGTEHRDRAGVLRFDFSGYGGDRLEEISWEDWFTTFDERGLRFIYQEHTSDGSDSNFFRLENPQREDA